MATVNGPSYLNKLVANNLIANKEMVIKLNINILNTKRNT